MRRQRGCVRPARAGFVAYIGASALGAALATAGCSGRGASWWEPAANAHARGVGAIGAGLVALGDDGRLHQHPSGGVGFSEYQGGSWQVLGSHQGVVYGLQGTNLVVVEGGGPRVLGKVAAGVTSLAVVEDRVFGLRGTKVSQIAGPGGEGFSLCEASVRSFSSDGASLLLATTSGTLIRNTSTTCAPETTPTKVEVVGAGHGAIMIYGENQMHLRQRGKAWESIESPRRYRPAHWTKPDAPVQLAVAIPCAFALGASGSVYALDLPIQ